MDKGLYLDLMEFTSLGVSDGVRDASAPRNAVRVRDWRAFDRAPQMEAWDALAKQASEPNPFYESWYLLPSLEAFDPQGRVALLTLEIDGQLLGLMPLRRKFSYYGLPLPHLANWTHPNTFLGAPLVARGFERVFWQHLLAWADRNSQLSLFFHLTHMPSAGPLLGALADVVSRAGRPAALVHSEERAMLSSELAPAAYLEASLTQKKRKELRRQERRLAEHGSLSFERHEDTTRLAEWTQEYLALEKRGWKGKNGSALACDPRTETLFVNALAAAARQGKLERLSLLLDGRPIAMLANFLSAPGAFSFKTAFDEDFARYSPGVLLQRENLGMLDRKAIAWTDSCAAEHHPMIDHFWRERRTIARYSIGIGGALRRSTFSQIARRETGHSPKGIA